MTIWEGTRERVNVTQFGTQQDGGVMGNELNVHRKKSDNCAPSSRTLVPMDTPSQRVFWVNQVEVESKLSSV